MIQRLVWALVLLGPASAWAQFPSSNISLPSFVMSTGGGTTSFPLLGTVGNCTTAPTYSFTGDTNTGWGSASADTQCWVIAGAEKLTLTATAMTWLSGIQLRSTSDTDGSIRIGGGGGYGSVAFGDAATHSAFETGAVVMIGVGSGGSVTSGVHLRAAAQIGWTPTATMLAAPDIVVGRIAADTFGPVVAGDAFGLASKFAIFTAPSGPVACTSPAVSWSNGTAAFQIDVGTTCAGVSTLVVTLPAVTNAWMCSAMNVTTSATAAIEMTASTTTSATFTNYTRTTGVVLVWVDGADVRISCLGG